MGLFGKRMKYEGDPLVEEPMAPSLEALGPAPVFAPAPAPEPVRRLPYGIEEAIRLMRTLPVDRNTELVVRVVRQTLESLNVRVADIIGDAERKEAVIQERIAKFKNDIAELEGFIQTHREEIGRLEADLAETTSVKQRLRLADGTVSGKVIVGG